MSNHAPAPKSDPTPTNRRITAGMIFALLLFYIAVFVAVNLLGFRFPMPVLVSFFLMVAVPCGLFVAGLIYFVFLLRLKLGGTPQKPQPLTLISAFIGATVLTTSLFVIAYPKIRQAQIESWVHLIKNAADPALPKTEVDQLASDVGVVIERIVGFYESSDIEAIENNPALVAAFQAVFTAATDNQLSPQEFKLLRQIIPHSQPATAPAAATATPHLP